MAESVRMPNLATIKRLGKERCFPSNWVRAGLDLHTSPTDCLHGVDVAYFSPHESRQFTSLYDQKPPMSLNVA